MTGVQHREYMARAIKLAAKGLYTTDPNPRVGCVIVKDNKIIGEGWHVRAGEPHAEVNALQMAGGSARNATVYVSLEPCSHVGRTPPCVNALQQAQVREVFVAMQDPNPQVAGRGIDALQKSGIDVEIGLLETQAQQLNPGFIKRMQTGLPFVRCKIAMSLDGSTAMSSGESKWITSDAARADAHHMRARSSAIMTGIGTVMADNPSLTVRLIDSDADYNPPIRVVIDSQLRISTDALIFTSGIPTIIYTTVDDQQRIDAIQTDNISVVSVNSSKPQVDLTAVLQDLGARGINEVLVESGAILNGALMDAGLVDEVIFYIAPSILGSNTRRAFELPNIQKMSEKIALSIVDTRQIGTDWRIMCVPIKH